METDMSGRLLITGDLHGDTAALTMITRQLREGDALFVAGDFGLLKKAWIQIPRFNGSLCPHAGNRHGE